MTVEISEQASILSDFPSGVSMLLPLTVACGQFMTSLDQNVVVTALPVMGRSFGQAPSQLGVLITVYVASLIISMPVGGWAADRFGLRNSYCMALVTFGVASVLCGMATNLWALIGARALQGVGGALMGTLGQIAILQSFPRNRTLKINMYMSLAGQSGPLVGPLVGGALATYVSWRWIFFINVPVALAATALAIFLFPAGTKSTRYNFDIVGFLLVGSGIAFLVFGMDSLAADDASGWKTMVEIAAALVVLAGAAFYCLRSHNPLLDLNLLRIRTFRISFLTGGGLDTIGLASVMFLLPLLFQMGFGMTAVQAGSMTFVAAVSSLSMRFFMPAILRRFGFRKVLITNTPIAAALVAGFALMHVSMPVWLMLAYIFVFGMFRSIQWASTGNLAYSDVTPEQLSRFSALYYILWQLAVAVSVGLASAALSFLTGNSSHADASDFRILFVCEGLITLSALLAYRRLRPEDGAHVSGYEISINE